MALPRWRALSDRELELKAKNARDYPSYLSGLCPNHHRSSSDVALIQSVMTRANLVWRRIRGSVLSEFFPQT